VRHCLVCGAVKVTVHAGDGRHWREWRLSDAGDQQQLQSDPECRAVEAHC
jgi:hypothetical protein